MSKRWGNVINPDDIVATYGADTSCLRNVHGPFESVNHGAQRVSLVHDDLLNVYGGSVKKVATQSTAKSSRGYKEVFIKQSRKLLKTFIRLGSIRQFQQ